MDSQYEVRYLLNGDEHAIIVDASSAAAASEHVRHQVVNDEEDDFELIQVQYLDDSQNEEETEE